MCKFGTVRLPLRTSSLCAAAAHRRCLLEARKRSHTVTHLQSASSCLQPAADEHMLTRHYWHFNFNRRQKPIRLFLIVDGLETNMRTVRA